MLNVIDESRVDGQGIKTMYPQNINHETNLVISSYFSKDESTGAQQDRLIPGRRNRPYQMSLAEIRKLVEEIMG